MAEIFKKYYFVLAEGILTVPVLKQKLFMLKILPMPMKVGGHRI